MLKKKSTFKPKVAARRNAPTPGSQNPERASKTTAPSAPQSQPPPPSASPGPPSNDKAPEIAEVHVAVGVEGEQPVADITPGRRTVAKASTGPGTAVSSVATSKPLAETPTLPQTEGTVHPVSTEPAPHSEEAAASDHVSSVPSAPTIATALVLPYVDTAPSTTSQKATPSILAAPSAERAVRQRTSNRTRNRNSRVSNAQDEAVQTDTPAPAGATSDQAPPINDTVIISEAQSSEPSAAPKKTAVSRGRKRNIAAGAAGEDDTSQTEGPAPPKKKPRPARRAALLPGEEGYQTAAEKRAAAAAKRAGKRKPEDGDDVATTETGEEGAVASRRRKSTRPQREATPEDAENVEIDITQVKMADLVKDMRVGKKFSLHDELMERERTKRQKYKKAQEDAAAEAAEKTGTPAPAGADAAVSKDATTEPEGRSGVLAPVGETYQMIDGVIVVDQRSLQVNRHARAAQEAGELEEHEENDFTHHTTSATYLRRNMRPQQWTDEETNKFFWALSMFGTDFETIARMFPGKTRKHIKLKFNREERAAPARIQSALVGQKTVGMDMDEYKRHTGSEYETAEAIYAEQKKAEEEFEARQKALQEAKDEEARKRREELFGSGNKEGDGQADGEEGGKKKKGRGRKAKRVEATW